MKTFDVYPVYPVKISKGCGSKVMDTEGNEYLDFYGGHAVISIGHSHPHYISRLTEQLNNIGFYSNSVEIPIQQETVAKLGALSGYENYDFFFCNSGSEAVENALKLASFHTGRNKVLAFSNAFHGRTSLSIMITDVANIQAPVNQTPFTETHSWNEPEKIFDLLRKGEHCAVIIEGIQGLGGIHIPSDDFLKKLEAICKETETVLILDEIQSGFGRSGKFFAHQHVGIQPDLITVAKGMGNGFPVGGVLISPKFEASYGLLGTTFGGNHMACASVLAVLEVIEKEDLITNAARLGEKLIQDLMEIDGVTVRGKGLMVGIDLPGPAAEIRKKLLFEEGIFTGSAKSKNTIRLLPPLSVSEDEIDKVVQSIKAVL